jgi:hypothetical protein
VLSVRHGRLQGRCGKRRSGRQRSFLRCRAAGGRARPAAAAHTCHACPRSMWAHPTLACILSAPLSALRAPEPQPSSHTRDRCACCRSGPRYLQTSGVGSGIDDYYKQQLAQLVCDPQAQAQMRPQQSALPKLHACGAMHLSPCGAGASCRPMSIALRARSMPHCQRCYARTC